MNFREMKLKSLLVTFSLSVSLIGCGGAKKVSDMDHGGIGYYGLAEIKPLNDSKVSGHVLFAEGFGKVTVNVELAGLDKNSKHGFHIHEFGDCSSPNGDSAGGHYNPAAHEHGAPTAETRHAGDLGNVLTDDKGRAKFQFEVQGLSINSGPIPIVGRGVIIHKNPDDLISQPTGGAGSRIGCGVIGIANKR